MAEPDNKVENAAKSQREETSSFYKDEAVKAFQRIENPSSRTYSTPHSVAQDDLRDYKSIRTKLANISNSNRIDSISEPENNEKLDYGLLGNIPGTNPPAPITQEYLRQEFGKKAGELFLKLTSPGYGHTPTGIDFTTPTADDISRMNTYLVIAAGGASDAKPDYSFLLYPKQGKPTDGKPIVNPATKQPYTAEDIHNLEISLDVQEIKALKKGYADHDKVFNELMSLPINSDDPAIKDYRAKLDASLAQITATFNSDTDKAFSGMLGTKVHSKEPTGADMVTMSQNVLNVINHLTYHPKTAIEVPYSGLKHAADSSSEIPPESDLNVQALLEALKLQQDNKDATAIVPSVTPPPPPPTPAPTPASPPAAAPPAHPRLSGRKR